jgi:DNA-binding HxlR family transcriptional regulator
MRQHQSSCPMDGLLRLLMGPWTTYILWVLRNHDEIRFGELKRQVPGISAKMLTDRLRMLEAAGLITRHQESTIPPSVSYRLGCRGAELNDVLGALNAIALRWAEEDAPTLPTAPGTAVA